MVNFDFNTTTYEFDFFSGAQISLYMGDILIDDVNTIQFQVIQPRTPIYGYASQYYSNLAPGQISVRGNFSINFKEAYYIISVLHEIANHKNPPIKQRNRKYLVNRENIERTLQGKKEYDKYELYNYLLALPDQEFENIAETFEDVIWRKPEKEVYETGNLSSSQLKSSTSSDILSYRRADQYPPFDIWILYGDIAVPAANHTIKRITDVTITGVQQAIDPSGQPIQEVYSFVAKNLI